MSSATMSPSERITATSAEVILDQPDPKKGSVRFNGGDRNVDPISNIYVNRNHPAIAGAKRIKVTIEALP